MIIAVANQKGGVAKSTTAINLAAGLSIAGYKVLLIDADPQTNTTRVFIHPEVELELDMTLYNSLIHLAPLSTIVRKTKFDNLSLVPSHIRLSGVDLELAQAFDNRSERLKRSLGKLREQYDYVVIDNPPSLGLLTINSAACVRSRGTFISKAIALPVPPGKMAIGTLVPTTPLATSNCVPSPP